MTLKQWIDAAKTLYDAGYGTGSSIGLKLRQASVQIKAENWEAAGDTLYEAGTFAYLFTEDILTRYTHQAYRITGALYWIDDNWPEEAPPVEVTMDAILSAMLKATNPQIQYFIGLVDAYRQSLWNRPFNREYFAALARGFMEWE
ncbi:MAG: hypothetical protein HWN68_19640 [Desulfobacterales bacterium]|nr:hypothetical protein [Desulfobacterales bacterium]